MSIFSRYKKSPGGLRALVELWETTPIERRRKMIEFGQADDPEFTKKALQYLLTFEDVLSLSDPELAELIATSPARIVGISVSASSQEIKDRFLRNSRPPATGEIRDCFDSQFPLREIGGAQLKLIAKTRELERKGLLKIKAIPLA